MACRITEWVQECIDPEGLAAFWCEVLGYEVLDRDTDWVDIGTPDGRVTMLFSRRTEVTPRQLRLHLDVRATDRDQEAELERLLSIGARHADVGQTGDEGWFVLQDPEGNVFCLLKRRVDP